MKICHKLLPNLCLSSSPKSRENSYFQKFSAQHRRNLRPKLFLAGTNSYFNRVIFNQLIDAATFVLSREKSTLLPELFPVELKFAVDTLNMWFKNTIKSKFLELNDIQKSIFVKEKIIDPSKRMWCICDFLLDIEGSHKTSEDKRKT